jgi:glucose-6-phosphate isomerase
VTPGSTPLIRLSAWQALEQHVQQARQVRPRDLFAADPTRGQWLSAAAAGLYLDYSKPRVTDETLRLLLQLAEESGLRDRIEAMFRGEKINPFDQWGWSWARRWLSASPLSWPRAPKRR